VTAVASPLARFLVKVFAWLPLAFAAWYFAAPVLLWPVKLVLELVARTGFADLVTAVEQNAANFTFVTLLKPGAVTARSTQLIVDVDGLLYSFGLPLFAALVVAARTPRWGRLLALGYAVMVPFIAFGVFADFLKDITLGAGPLVASQTGFSAWQREAIAFSYQVGALILPTIVPVVAWLLTHRAFLERMRRTS
jgi:hypothetical protein